MLAFGFAAEQIAKARAKLEGVADDDVFQVHPDNATAVRLFSALSTQWSMVALATMDRAEIRPVGLDYVRLEATARLCRLELGDHDFARIRIMEAEALTAWAEVRR